MLILISYITTSIIKYFITTIDVALQIVEDHPELARNVSLLAVLARKPCAILRFEKNHAARIIEPSKSSGVFIDTPLINV